MLTKIPIHTAIANPGRAIMRSQSTSGYKVSATLPGGSKPSGGDESIVRFLVVIFVALAAPAWSTGERVRLVGNVVDSGGHPIEHATVLIYHAGVKKGYSIFCPNCYADCGKRANSGPDGAFAFEGLAPDLLFEILAVRDGFQPVLIKNIDPLSPAHPKAVLLPRLAADRPEQIVRGRVVNDEGRPLADSVIQAIGISMKDGKDEESILGTPKGLEPIAITNANGEFEIANQKPALAILLSIEARGYAPGVRVLNSGADQKTITISRGSVIRGRLVDHGRPVAGAEIGVSPRYPGGIMGHLKLYGDLYGEIRVGTQADGSFVLADVPNSVDWYIYAKMESLSKGLATAHVDCTSKHSGEITDVGDLQLELGHHLKGKVVLSDGESIPDGMRLQITADHGMDSQVVPIRQYGAFEFSGLPTGRYNIYPAVRGYQSKDLRGSITVDHDIDDLTISLRPK